MRLSQNLDCSHKYSDDFSRKIILTGKILSVIFLFVLHGIGFGATAYTWNGSTTDWATAGNWSPSGVPGDVAGDSVDIPTGVTSEPTLGVTPLNALVGLTIGSGKTLTTAAGITLTVSGPTVIDGTLTPTTTTIFSFAAVTIGATGAFGTGTGSGLMTFSGDFINNGTFNGGSGINTFTGNWTNNTANYTATSATTNLNATSSNTNSSFAHNNGTVIVTGGTLTLGADTTFKTLTINSGATLDLAGFNLPSTTAMTVSSGATLQLKGPESVSTTPTLSAGSLVKYQGTSSSPQAIQAWPYKNLELNTTAITYTLPGVTTVGENLTVTLGTLSTGANANNLTVTGTTSIAASQTLTSATYSSTLSFSDTVSISGALTNGSGLMTFNKDLTINATGTLTLGTGNMAFDGNLIYKIIGAGTFTPGANLTTISSGTTTLGSNITFGALTISNGAALNLAGFDLPSGTAITVSNGATLQLKGSETVNTNPTLNAGSLVKYQGTAAGLAIKAWTYKKLELNTT
ncbi:MAG: hypothetical protein PHW04_01835, partial [Candidatus Wallbacteria bacterium]|nr:hypothetical protein [Candidatus Wallbacteria bacterium]